MLHTDLVHAVDRYLAVADRLLPGWVTGQHVVGSAALGAWIPGRSDVDCVVVVDGSPAVSRLRLLHVLGNAGPAARAVRQGRPDRLHAWSSCST